MRTRLLFFGFSLMLTNAMCQVGIGTTTPSQASMLEVSSSSDGGSTFKGFMPPRVPDVAARDAINPTPEDEGLLIFIQSYRCLQVWTGIAWENIYCNGSAALASNLFISEYVEGSSNNKVIEIANFTGMPVSLDNYHLFISFNGGGTTSLIPFITGFILEDGDVYVIKHPQANSSIPADQTDNRLNFNGNDAVVLRTTTGTHIDILGDINSNEYYGRDLTLRKKPTLGPSTTFQPSDYLVFGIDDFTDIGRHSYFK
ncbi:MAG TPA: lamin tail domain-containing protein [Aequorivita sp.]|nr:lamin tail domain-containing protein [Aequorivita sp.]